MRLLTAIGIALLILQSPAARPADEPAAAFFEQLLGTYDSLAHREEDMAAGLDEKQAHGWVTRTFTAIDAPAIGQYTALATVTYNGPEGIFDEGEFQVWTISYAGIYLCNTLSLY